MDAETLKKGILRAAIEGGGEMQHLPNSCQDILRSQTIPDLTHDELIRAVETTDDNATLSFILIDHLWYYLPWEVGDAIFRRLFQLGNRDDGFLHLCMAYYSMQGPEGDARLLSFMDQLDAEGKGDLKQLLDPDNFLVKTYR